MQTVIYTGPSDVRVVSAADLARLGITDQPTDLIFNKANAYTMNVPDDVALVLFTQFGFVGGTGETIESFFTNLNNALITLGPSNGTDDTATIQTAIDAANTHFLATGALTYIYGAPGVTYKVTYGSSVTYQTASFALNPALVIKSGAFICNLSILAPDYVATSVAVIGDQGTAAASSNWGVIGCSFNGQAPGSTAIEVFHEGIIVGNSTNFWIRNNTFQKFRGDAMMTLTTTTTSLSVARGWISGNNIQLCMAGAVRLHGGRDIWITDNTADTCLNAAYAQNPAPNCFATGGTYTHQGITITGNRVYDWGIGYTIDGNVTDLILAGNYNRCPSGGFGTGLVLASNAGPTLTRAVIRDNIFDQSLSVTSGNFAGAIGGLAKLVDVSIVGNQIVMGNAATDAISFTNAGAGSVRVTIADNLIDGNVGLYDGVISAANIADLTIASNRIAATGMSGSILPGVLVASSCSQATISENVVNGGCIEINCAGLIRGNTVVNNSTGIAAINIGAPGTNVIGNTITATSHRGVASGSTNANCVVADNTITVPGTGDSAILLQGGSSVVTGNLLNSASAAATFREANNSGNLVEGNLFTGTSTNYLNMLASTTSVVRGNIGPNPIGTVSPAVPATTVAVAAVHYNRTFYVTAGASTCTMAIQGGPSPVVPSGGFATIRVPAGKTVTPTYASAPTWVVEGE